jgi:hypothetical protein
MSKKVTYLLGAGASAKALPLIKQITDAKAIEKMGVVDLDILQGLPQELFNFSNQIVDKYQYTSRNSTQQSKPEALRKLAEGCIEFGTPDLYAKFLLEKGDDLNYHQLKTLISNYFIFKQASGAFDIRALSFLTTISTNKSLPKEVGIISWNYDTQIEIAANRLRTPISSPSDSIANFASWPNIPNPNYKNDYFLVHLNGVAGYHYDANDLSIPFDNYRLFDHTKEPMLSFAWEDDSYIYKRTFTENRLKLALKIASETKILVVIGYTFPFFNRWIDNEIIKEMLPSLKKIYFQDPYLNGDFLYDQFDIPREDEEYRIGAKTRKKVSIKHIANVDQYYVPYEL